MLERILDIHIRQKIEGKKSKAPHAYTKGKTTESALHEVVLRIETSLVYKQF